MTVFDSSWDQRRHKSDIWRGLRETNKADFLSLDYVLMLYMNNKRPNESMGGLSFSISFSEDFQHLLAVARPYKFLRLMFRIPVFPLELVILLYYIVI